MFDDACTLLAKVFDRFGRWMVQNCRFQFFGVSLLQKDRVIVFVKDVVVCMLGQEGLVYGIRVDVEEKRKMVRPLFGVFSPRRIEHAMGWWVYEYIVNGGVI